MTDSPGSHAPDTHVHTLANGARVLTIRLPHLESVHVSVFVRTGSRHESPRLNGISHFVEHMAFKGTHERSCQQINLDAERLGADVNAHTDKDHTAYHMRGMAGDAGRFIAMLGDIVRNSTFPEAELEREREVILHEFVEDEEDPLATAYKLFDQACYGSHALAQPVIGTRRNIRRISRDDLLGYVERQYSGANLVVGIAGNVDPAEMAAAAEAAFGSMPAGVPNAVAAPLYQGGVRSRRQSGCSQVDVVLGFPIAPSTAVCEPGIVAAALFGEGMSSPLLDEIRERRGLAYYAACSADVTDLSGQFVIEAATSPEHVDEFLAEVLRLLALQAERTDPVAHERARRQLAVRTVSTLERPGRRLEDAAQDLFVHGRVRSRSECMERLQSVSAEAVRDVFRQMHAATPALALAGKVRQQDIERARKRLAAR